MQVDGTLVFAGADQSAIEHTGAAPPGSPTETATGAPDGDASGAVRAPVATREGELSAQRDAPVGGQARPRPGRRPVKGPRY